jgi:hypothetical protein
MPDMMLFEQAFGLVEPIGHIQGDQMGGHDLGDRNSLSNTHNNHF